MRDIKDRLEALDLNVNHVTKSAEKGKAFVEYMKSKVTVNVDSKRAELENELAEVLKDTASGLESLSSFLDAVEKLAVTSLHVFTENQVLHLPEGISPEYVQAVILAARVICPLLLEFKRDDNVFFLPKLQNVEVLAYQLDRYIQTSKTICEKLDKSEFDKRQPTMLQFLKELEETAVQLDRMNKGAKISSVAGSSVGAVGDVLSIVGLALIPFTAGVSLALTMTGVGLGITSGVNSAVTTATEVGVNATQRKKASEVFKNFMEDVQSLQSCLEEIAKNAGAIGKGIDALVDSASAVKMLQTEELLTSAGKVVAQEGQALRNAPRVASDIPDIGLIALNALFLGMDIFFICKDSMSLAKGSETEVSQFIRARCSTHAD
uniref:Si:ch73-233k15.2 n=1 Tax=Pundamilia nyererei TaxID=303518 RepID=A0A3B4HBL4_9CICH